MFDVLELNFAIEVWGVAFCIIGIICSLLLVQTQDQYRNTLIAMFSLELLAAMGDATTILFVRQTSTLGRTMLYVGNFTFFSCTFLLQAAVTYYLCLRFSETGGPSYPTWRIVITIIAILMCILTALGAFYYYDENSIYQRSDLYWLSLAYVAGASLVNSALVVGNRKRLADSAIICLLFYTGAPIITSIIQASVRGPNLAIAVGVLGLIVVFIEMQTNSSRVLVSRTEALARAEADAAESRIAVTVAQIQPHFLFNTLDTIYGLVDEDSNIAKEAIDSFSRYLRTNLATLNQTKPVLVETEIAHARTYLELEHLSDPERISYEIDIEATGFLVPALAVQTLVENAVKHGIGKRPEGGTVRIQTRELNDEFLVEIADDGVGFIVDAHELTGEDGSEAEEIVPETNEPGPNNSSTKSGTGIGIENTRSRLETMCNGSLELQSSPGEGTRAIIHIPKN